MRGTSFGAAAALALLMPLVQVPTAWAGPVAELCTPDPARGSVPAVFVLDACVDAAGVTVRNPLDVPVVVTASGDLGAAQRVDPSDGPQDTLVRLSGGDELVLVPGDVVRWPLGAATGEIVVSGLSAPAVVAVSDALGDLLPRRGDPDVPADAYPSLAALVDVTAAAVAERAACREGRNFLGTAACDVDAATTIGEAATVRLSRGDTNRAVPVLLDPGNWDAWAAVRPAPVGSSAERTLRLAAAPLRVPAPPPVVVPPAPRPAPSAPAPVPPPLPAPVPLPVPASLPAVPAPVPAPAPIQPLPSAPSWPSWQELLDRYAGKANGNGTGNGKNNGNGKSNGHGNGRGDDGDDD